MPDKSIEPDPSMFLNNKIEGFNFINAREQSTKQSSKSNDSTENFSGKLDDKILQFLNSNLSSYLLINGLKLQIDKSQMSIYLIFLLN